MSENMVGPWRLERQTSTTAQFVTEEKPNPIPAIRAKRIVAIDRRVLPWLDLRDAQLAQGLNGSVHERPERHSNCLNSGFCHSLQTGLGILQRGPVFIRRKRARGNVIGLRRSRQALRLQVGFPSQLEFLFRPTSALRNVLAAASRSSPSKKFSNSFSIPSKSSGSGIFL